MAQCWTLAVPLLNPGYCSTHSEWEHWQEVSSFCSSAVLTEGSLAGVTGGDNVEAVESGSGLGVGCSSASSRLLFRLLCMAVVAGGVGGGVMTA